MLIEIFALAFGVLYGYMVGMWMIWAGFCVYGNVRLTRDPTLLPESD
jgi:hypothetical protein